MATAETDTALVLHPDGAGGVEWGTDATGGGGLGAWTNFTPTWTASTTNPTLGNGTLVGRYKLLDSKTLLFNIYVLFGTTTNAGSGTYSWALPAGMTAAAYRQTCVAHISDAGTTRYVASGAIGVSSTTINLLAAADAGGNRNVAHNLPITWADGDYILINGTIEIV